MKYMILIFGEEAKWAAQTPDEMAKGMAAYMAYGEALRAAGKYVNGHELNSVSTAKTVAVREGAPHVADGPFADTKEQIGGYYLIDAADEAEALSWAARCPGAHHGTVELRPIIEH